MLVGTLALTLVSIGAWWLVYHFLLQADKRKAATQAAAAEAGVGGGGNGGGGGVGAGEVALVEVHEVHVADDPEADIEAAWHTHPQAQQQQQGGVDAPPPDAYPKR